MRPLWIAPLLMTPLLLAALPATAQNSASPMSNNAGNLMGGMGGMSGTAAKLPIPSVADDSAQSYLKAARSALAAGKTGMAQEALERAESRLLDRDVAPSQAASPSSDPSVTAISQILQNLGAGKKAEALQLLDALIAKM